MYKIDESFNYNTNELEFLNSRYISLASNTVDYWMTPDSREITAEGLLSAISDTPVSNDTTLQIYIHVPFCVQRCLFCVFSGGNSSDFKDKAEPLSRLLVWQLQDLLNRTNVKNHPIQSIHIGGGSPNLLGKHIGYILNSV